MWVTCPECCFEVQVPADSDVAVTATGLVLMHPCEVCVQHGPPSEQPQPEERQ